MAEPLAFLVPVLGRPQNVGPLLDSIEASTPEPYRVLFIVDPDDQSEIAAIEPFLETDRVKLLVKLSRPRTWGAKINAGVEKTDAPLLFLGADDLTFKPGWLEAAKEQIDAGAQVVGVNDLIRRPHRPEHATHFLMTRAYAEQPTLDGQPGPVSTAYHHWYCDDELIGTATARGGYAYAVHSHVEHRHPMMGTADDDETYILGRARTRQDKRTFERRRALWTAAS